MAFGIATFFENMLGIGFWTIAVWGLIFLILLCIIVWKRRTVRIMYLTVRIITTHHAIKYFKDEKLRTHYTGQKMSMEAKIKELLEI